MSARSLLAVLPLGLVASLSACGEGIGSGEPGVTCAGSFCALPDDGKLDKTAPASSVEHLSWGKAMEIVGSPDVNQQAVGDLELIAATAVGAELLGQLEAAVAKIDPEKRFVLRPRSEEPGNDLSMCGRTLFANGGFDQKRARPQAYHVDDAGKVVVDQPGDAISPERIRVIFNRACAPTYPDGTSCAAPYTWLFHELIHVLHAMRGTLLDAIPDGTDPAPSGSNHEESWTVGRGPYSDEPVSENALRAVAGFALRDTYFSLCGPR